MADRLRQLHEILRRKDRSESVVIRTVKEIGELVVQTERATNDHDVDPPTPQNRRTVLRDDECFAYFCEHSMLKLLIELARNGLMRHETNRERVIDGLVSFVNNEEPDDSEQEMKHSIQNAKIKAQVLRTVSTLVSGVKDTTALFYLLSHHSINQLILLFLPLSQWTDPILEEILMPYADLLKTLALQLGGYHGLFPFFTVVHEDGKSSSFPLYSAILHTATSTSAQFDSFLHATCLNLIVGLLKIPDPVVGSWMGQADHSVLCRHLDRTLRKTYQKLVDLTTGPIVDNRRSNATKSQTSLFDAQVDALNDVFWCSVTSLNRQLCETILEGFVQRLLHDMVPQRVNLSVGISDNDVIPDQEAKAQAAIFVLSRLFLHLKYEPLTRMLAVSFFHERKPRRFDQPAKKEQFPRTSDLVKLINEKDCECDDAERNHALQEVTTSLRGSYGEWRFLGACELVKAVLSQSTLQNLKLFGPSSVIENALTTFLSQNLTLGIPMLSTALEGATFLSLQFLSISAQSNPQTNTLKTDSNEMYSALRAMRDSLAAAALKSRSPLRVNSIVCDLVNSIVCDMYKRVVRNGKPVMAYQLFQHPIESLTRQLRSVPLTDVERSRNLFKMALHYRAVCHVVERCRDSGEWPSMDDISHLADHMLVSIFSCLQETWPIGTDLDLQGRTTFHFDNPFVTEFARKVKTEPTTDCTIRKRTLSEDVVLRTSLSGLLLVLDPTDIFIVKPLATTGERGTIICSVPLLDVVGAAVDDECLHVAVRHDNVGFLIKNGNMVLSFDSPSTAMIVSRYLDRCGGLLRKEMYTKIEDMLTLSESSTRSDDGFDQIPHSKTL